MRHEAVKALRRGKLEDRHLASRAEPNARQIAQLPELDSNHGNHKSEREKVEDEEDQRKGKDVVKTEDLGRLETRGIEVCIDFYEQHRKKREEERESRHGRDKVAL